MYIYLGLMQCVHLKKKFKKYGEEGGREGRKLSPRAENIH